MIDGDGRQARDFVYVDDTVEALTRALDRAGGLVVNVGTGTATTIRELWALLKDDEPTHGPPVPGEIGRLALSPTPSAHPAGLGAVDRPGDRPANPRVIVRPHPS